jgi:hypothetical protein
MTLTISAPIPSRIRGCRATRDWHAPNIKMVEALSEKKYDLNDCWGIGTHSNKQGGAIMPEMLRWL